MFKVRVLVRQPFLCLIGVLIGDDMAEYDGITHFLKAAPRRLADAFELLEPPSYKPQASDASHRNLLAAKYLASYVVECILKAYIISRVQGAQTLRAASTVMQQQRVDASNLSSAKGHSIQLLLSLTDLEAAPLPDDIKTSLGICLKWKSTWRYSPDPVQREDARKFVTSAEKIFKFVRNRI